VMMTTTMMTTAETMTMTTDGKAACE
jgi:hypothetical protein